MTDADLVGRVLGGDASAFTGLVERHGDRALRYARRMLDNREDAEEAVQDAFVRAYTALGRYEERQRFQAWFFGILVNECRMAARKRRRQERWLVVSDEATLDTRAASVGNGVYDGRLEELEREIARLPATLREAFLLRHVEEMDYAEMHAMTGAGVSALKMRVKRACDALRIRVEEER